MAVDETTAVVPGGSAMPPAPDESLVLSLDSLAATIDQVGGKGVSLARLAVAGLPVPPGVHLTTSMYRRFVDGNHLAESILTAASLAQVPTPRRSTAPPHGFTRA